MRYNAAMRAMRLAWPFFFYKEVSMGEDEKKAKEDLTENEQEEMEETDETAEEAHRQGEFEELKALIADLASEVAAGFKALDAAVATMRGIAIDNGAELDDEDGDDEDAERFEVPDYDEMDFNL